MIQRTRQACHRIGGNIRHGMSNAGTRDGAIWCTARGGGTPPFPSPPPLTTTRPGQISVHVRYGRRGRPSRAARTACDSACGRGRPRRAAGPPCPRPARRPPRPRGRPAGSCGGRARTARGWRRRGRPCTGRRERYTGDQYARPVMAWGPPHGEEGSIYEGSIRTRLVGRAHPRWAGAQRHGRRCERVAWGHTQNRRPLPPPGHAGARYG